MSTTGEPKYGDVARPCSIVLPRPEMFPISKT